MSDPAREFREESGKLLRAICEMQKHMPSFDDNAKPPMVCGNHLHVIEQALLAAKRKGMEEAANECKRLAYRWDVEAMCNGFSISGNVAREIERNIREIMKGGNHEEE